MCLLAYNTEERDVQRIYCYSHSHETEMKQMSDEELSQRDQAFPIRKGVRTEQGDKENCRLRQFATSVAYPTKF